MNPYRIFEILLPRGVLQTAKALFDLRILGDFAILDDGGFLEFPVVKFFRFHMAILPY